MRAQVSEIKTLNRIRKDLGDLSPLVDSMRRVGQLQSILLDSDNRLICGYRRLEAAKALGWDSIEAKQIDVDSRHDLLLMEAEENISRKSFTSDEMARIDDLLHRHSRPGVLWKFIAYLMDLLERLFKR